MRRRRLVAATVIATLGSAFLWIASGSGQEGPVRTNPQPALGVADIEMELMGAAPDGAPGETWGYRLLPLDVPPPVLDGRRLEYGGDRSSTRSQLAFLRHTDATGWQVVETPLDGDGPGARPYRGFLPNGLSPRITRRGGGILLGRDIDRQAGQRARVLRRDPGGRYGLLEDPPPNVLLPAAAGQGAETLAEDDGRGELAVAAVEEGPRTGVFFAIKGRQREDAVAHHDGANWSREPIVAPTDVAGFEVLSVAATSADNAFLLARSEPAEPTPADPAEPPPADPPGPADPTDPAAPDDPADPGRGIELYQRVSDTPGNRCPDATGDPASGAQPSVCWVPVPLEAELFEQTASPDRGVTSVRGLAPPADSLSASADGLWIDGSLRTGTSEADFTLFFDISDGRVTGTWCDARDSSGTALCDNPLGNSLSRMTGYRSFAFAGAGFGSRVITNPLRRRGDEESNLGTYLRLDGTRFTRVPGGGGNRRRSGAFSSPFEGWLEGPIQIARGPRPDRLRKWPVSLRSPLTAVDHEPGTPRGDLGSRSLAVGIDGAVARYLPEQGWTREFLIGSSGGVARSNLRGVAWPERARAHAVGDVGAMWLWREETNLWEPDPAKPIGFEGNLMDVDFDPTDPDRGFAVGKEGVLLRYDKTWTQEPLPAGFETTDFTQVTFAGFEALAAAGADLLVNRGSGWVVDQGVRELLAEVATGEPRLFAVAGLPDGGAVAAGRDFVIERDTADGPWRFADQPLINSSIVALGAFREGPRVRSLVSVVPRIEYPLPDVIPEFDENTPPPIVGPFPLPGDGYVLRETAAGWRDEQRTGFNGSGIDRPLKSDPIAAFDLDVNGEGWSIGGWSGEADFAGRGSSSRGGSGRADRQRVQTAGIYRYAAVAGPPGPQGAETAPITFDTDAVRFTVGGHAQCEEACSDLEAQDIAPDRTLRGALAKAGGFSRQERGPRFVLYTGGRSNPLDPDEPQPQAEANRYAELLRSDPSLPVFPAVAAGDVTGKPPTAGPFRRAFGDFPAPFGSGPEPAGITRVVGVGADPEPGEARTHYAFDTTGPGGTVRVIVIDNAAGSLAASDAHQNPVEPGGQAAWLRRVLGDAREKGIVAVVSGSRDLSRFAPRLNLASDGDQVARLLVDGGASAYFFERPEENRTYPIPSGARRTIPSFGTGTLGYRSPVSEVLGSDSPDSLFGDTAFLLVDIDPTKRDATSGRAPVNVRTIPVVDELALQAVDGTLLRRSRPALFLGLGRRPIAGDRWGRQTGEGPSPPGGSPFVAFPPDPCLIAGCNTRLTPEYQFSSSNPDVGDFVRQDPNSTNLRKPLIDTATDKPVASAASGLFCAFNSGTTTVTIRAGGLAFSQTVTVLGGSVLRPCGTVPLKNPPPAKPPDVVLPPPPPPPPSVVPAVAPTPPPPPPAEEPPPPAPEPDPPAPERPDPPRPDPPPPSPPPPALTVSPPVPTKSADGGGRSAASNPPANPVGGQPIPPGGAVARVFQVEEKREEELAPEESQAFSRYSPEEHGAPGLYVFGVVLLAALAGAVVRGGPRDRDRPRAATAEIQPPRDPYHPRTRRRP